MDWFLNTLSPWQWGVILAVPPAIVALYFLKLTRQPLEVPSTYLWSKTIEDLHVNSLWQRLRENILLYLQLLLLALAILACLRPGWQGSRLTGERFIFMLDASGSMQASDVSPSRFAAAKQQIADMIHALDGVQVAMLISFSDSAKIEQSFTSNTTLLLRALEDTRVTNRRSDIGEALVAASGLANPGRFGSRENPDDVAAPEARPATVFVFSDGGFPPASKFQQGNLTFRYVKIGSAPEEVSNLAVAAFTADRNPEKPQKLQAFGRIENYGLADVETEVSLYVDGQLRDVSKVKVPAATAIDALSDAPAPKKEKKSQAEEEETNVQRQYVPGSAGVQFELGELDSGKLELRIEKGGTLVDHLALDNSGWTAIQPTRRIKVLVVSPRNDALDLALTTKLSQRQADVTFQTPDLLAKDTYRQSSAAGAWDLIIFDQCAPDKMPACNTLTIGKLPPGNAWKGAAMLAANPGVIDIDRAHPLMQYVELADVAIAEAMPLKGPSGATSLVDADCGTILAIAPREGYEDIVMGFEIYGQATKDGKTELTLNTNWPFRHSFAMFVRNLLEYFGAGRGDLVAPTFRPGSTVNLRTDSPVEKVEVETPSNRREEILRGTSSGFSYTGAESLGIYQVREGKNPDPLQQFAVNLFDSNESSIAARPFVVVGAAESATSDTATQARQEIWPWLLIGAFVVLMVEWYIYNRRVYL